MFIWQRVPAKRKGKDNAKGDRQDEQPARKKGREEAGKKSTLGSQAVSHKRWCAAVRQGSLLSTQLSLRAKGVASRSNRSDETRAES